MTQLPPSITLLTDLVHIDLRRNALTSIDKLDFQTMSRITMLNVNFLPSIAVFFVVGKFTIR
jgi:hypothetical protein